MASYRSQCNLHLYFAEQYLRNMVSDVADDWSGHFPRACRESAVWQMQLAYQAHIADVIVQQPRFSLAVPNGVFRASSFQAAELPPEIMEMADREREGWLNALISYAFLESPASSQGAHGGLARDALIASDHLGNTELNDAEAWLAELKSLVTRHRSTLQEY